jgi:hypothetical protein
MIFRQIAFSSAVGPRTCGCRLEKRRILVEGILMCSVDTCLAEPYVVECIGVHFTFKMQFSPFKIH